MVKSSMMLYNIWDRVPTKKMFLFAIQMVLSVFVATVLIASICGVNVSAALIGAGVSTLIYGFCTNNLSPMFVSNSGAFVAPVIMALAAAGYTGVAVGGLTTCIIYCIFGYIFSRVPLGKLYKVMPTCIIGSITCVIGLTLMSFIPSYVQVNGESNQYGVIVALFTMFLVAICSHFAKGMFKILPLMLGTLGGYGLSILLTITGVCPLIDFSVFNNMKLFCMPEFAFTKFSPVAFATLVPIIIIYIAYTISAICECISDHAALGTIVEVDLFRVPGLSRIFVGEGMANLAGSCLGGLGQCSYGESCATIGFSRVASPKVTKCAAIMLALMGLFAPIQVFINSIPSCVFGGCAIILYGFIACSGIKMLSKVNLNEQKNVIITSAIISIGVSGIILGNQVLQFSGTALALLVGIVLNFVLKDKKTLKDILEESERE